MGRFDYHDRSAKATVKHLIGGEKPAAVYVIDDYEITVPGATEETAVTYRHSRWGGDPRDTLPNIEVKDGEIRIPVTDLVGEVLKRIEPLELAQALWHNDDVRREFMYCLTTRYSEQGIGDDDRRTFLREVKEAVHSKAVDQLASEWAKIEYKLCRHAHHYDEIRRINETLHSFDVRYPIREGETEGRLVQFDARDTWTKDSEGKSIRGELEVSGKAWTEARDFWRTECAKHFPAPVAEAETVPA